MIIVCEANATLDLNATKSRPWFHVAMFSAHEQRTHLLYDTLMYVSRHFLSVAHLLTASLHCYQLRRTVWADAVRAEGGDSTAALLPVGHPRRAGRRLNQRSSEGSGYVCFHDSYCSFGGTHRVKRNCLAAWRHRNTNNLNRRMWYKCVCCLRNCLVHVYEVDWLCMIIRHAAECFCVGWQ